MKTSTFEQQIIGNLDDVIYSPNKERVCSHKGCSIIRESIYTKLRVQIRVFHSIKIA